MKHVILPKCSVQLSTAMVQFWDGDSGYDRLVLVQQTMAAQYQP